jgi:hypothetical protein
VNYEWQEKRIEIENNSFILEKDLMLLLLTSSENTDFMDKEFKLKGVNELDFLEIDTIESRDLNNDELSEFIIEGHLNIPD